MALFDFVSSILEKRRGVREYQAMLSRFLGDGVLSDDEQQQLKALQATYHLSDADLRAVQCAGASNAFKQITSDERITEEERKALGAILNFFGIEKTDIQFDQSAFNKYYSLALIDQGVLPAITNGNHDLNIVFKKGEVLHHGQSAVLRKLKRVTTRVHYGGFTSSIKITKGLRYRVGSLRVGATTTETLAAEDSGGFYLTNQRVGFMGGRKHFSLPYNKSPRSSLGQMGSMSSRTGESCHI